MAIRILELHEQPPRKGATGGDPLQGFYRDLLGLDPALRAELEHGALAVESIAEARAELDRLGVEYGLIQPPGGAAVQLLLRDPEGRAVELHERGRCACRVLPLDAGASYARLSGTILFADMRGFTAVAEMLGPDQVVTLLNEYYSMLTAETAAHGGTVFHFAGDGMMAGFGVTEPQPDACARAVSAARAMIEGFGRLSDDWRRRHDLDTGLGIGINSGELVAGRIGAPQRSSYTLIGDSVNVAARLVQRARAGEALFSREVRQSLAAYGGDEDVLRLPPMVLRGRRNPVEIYCIPAKDRLDLRPAG